MKIFLTILFTLFGITTLGNSLDKEEYTDTRAHYIMSTCIFAILLFLVQFKL